MSVSLHLSNPPFLEKIRAFRAYLEIFYTSYIFLQEFDFSICLVCASPSSRFAVFAVEGASQLRADFLDARGYGLLRYA